MFIVFGARFTETTSYPHFPVRRQLPDSAHCSFDMYVPGSSLVSTTNKQADQRIINIWFATILEQARQCSSQESSPILRKYLSIDHPFSSFRVKMNYDMVWKEKEKIILS